jgi:hypothetical protein
MSAKTPEQIQEEIEKKNKEKAKAEAIRLQREIEEKKDMSGNESS